VSAGHVVVAGGGIGGLAAAAALASSGFEVTVVERAAYIGDVGSGLLLHQNGIVAADAVSARLGEGIRNGLGVQIFAAPAGGNTLYWTAKITSPPGVWPAMGQQGALTALLDRIADWHEPVVRMVRSANPAHLSVTDIHDRDPVSRWVEGRVALLGDAAHPMAPAMGQGANTAIEDAVVLARSLREHGDPNEALLRYQAARVGRTSRIVLHSRRQGALDQGASREQARARDDVMRQRGRKDAATLDIVDWRPDTADPFDEADRGPSAPALRPDADAAGV
jgi:2-polyprenyl-6-methoxyphenol hydroxylase-like FAD-dependent oxidoreductase